MRFQTSHQLTVAAAFVLTAGAAAAQQQRPMEIEDLFTLEQLGTVVASPDGSWLAIVVARSRSRLETYGNGSGGDVAHADIWIAPREGGAPRNLTNGRPDKRGYWNPVWSPDGKRLAMLSTQDGEQVFPYVWEAKSGTLRQLTERRADLSAYGEESFLSYGMIWSDSTTVLCPVAAEDAPPMYYTRLTPAPYLQMMKGWAASDVGAEPSVSIVESGREVPQEERPSGQLLAVDAKSGHTQVVAQGNFRQLLLSPTRTHLALIAETGRIPPRPHLRIPYGSRFRELWRTRLFLVSLPELSGKWVDSIIDPTLRVEDIPHSWSPDGSELAVLAKGSKSAAAATTLWVVSTTDGSARRRTAPNMEVLASAWSLGGDLAFLGRPVTPTTAEGDTSRCDWWGVSKTNPGKARNLTSGLGVVPPRVAPTPQSRTVVGIASGDLWSIDARTGSTANLTVHFTAEVQSQVWPSGIQQHARYRDALVVRTTDDALYRVDWRGSSIDMTPLARPAKGAVLASFLPSEKLSIFTGIQPNGTFIWTGDGASDKFRERLVLNRQVAQIAEPQRRLVGYRGADGDSLKAVLILPSGYVQGKRFPLVTWIYPGWMVDDTSFVSFLYDKQSVSSLNLSILLAHGYGLLIPSLPLPPDGYASDPYLEMPKGVIAAIDRTIELGFADSERLALMGHSFGGYATYSLLTYTHRFKAAVALAGPSNLISIYGEFLPHQRYGDFPHEELFQPALAESGQLRLVATPWRDLWRYLRNSPISYADRVDTPVLIIQGDMDYVPLQQGEEFFTALYRLGKRAKFVRYWGEGHVIASPANMRDMWDNILEWLDANMTGSVPPKEIEASLPESLRVHRLKSRQLRHDAGSRGR